MEYILGILISSSASPIWMVLFLVLAIIYFFTITALIEMVKSRGQDSKFDEVGGFLEKLSKEYGIISSDLNSIASQIDEMFDTYSKTSNKESKEIEDIRKELDVIGNYLTDVSEKMFVISDNLLSKDIMQKLNQDVIQMKKTIENITSKEEKSTERQREILTELKNLTNQINSRDNMRETLHMLTQMMGGGTGFANNQSSRGRIDRIGGNVDD